MLDIEYFLKLGLCILMPNAYSTGKICVADICAKMAVGFAQIGAQQNFSYGYFCYALAWFSTVYFTVACA